MDNRIYRSRETKMLAGVCGGIADMFNIDPTLVRLVAVALTIFSGFTFLLVYFLCAIIIPLEPSPGYILRRHQQPAAPAKTGDSRPVDPVPQNETKYEEVQPDEFIPVKKGEEVVILTERPESSSVERQEYRNDETVINSKADKY